MPNTLCHFAVQTPLSRLFIEKRDILWVVVGCVVPDLPWILLKGLLALGIFNPYDLRLYAMVQASLFLCLLLSLAIAVLTSRPVKVFAILSVNCLIHLLVDSLQIKWGNGVHLFAPFNWEMFYIGLSWPEHMLTQLISIAGVPVLLYNWRSITRAGLDINYTSGARVLLSAMLLLFYLTGPVIFFDRLESSNSYYIQTMRNTAERSNRKIEFDRAQYDADTQTAKNYAGERFIMKGLLPPKSGRVSFQGFFASPSSIVSTGFHYHKDFRDSASMLGLFMACALLLHSLLITLSRKTKP